MEGQDEKDGAPSDHQTTQQPQLQQQPPSPSSNQDATLLRDLEGVSRTQVPSSNPVSHNGRVYIHQSNQPRPTTTMDSVEAGPDADSLADDTETTESSATTVVCDSRFFCATPDNPDNPDHLDSLDQISGAEDNSDLDPQQTTRSLDSTPSPPESNLTGLNPADLHGDNRPSPSSPMMASRSDSKRNELDPEGPNLSPSPATSPHPELETDASSIYPQYSINTDEPPSLRSSSPSLSSGMSASSGQGLILDLPEEQVAAYLDRHPQVVERWLRERAPRTTLKSLRSGRNHLQADQLGRSWESDARDTPTSAASDYSNVVANYSYPSRKNSISSWLSPKSKKSKKVERLTEPELFMELIRDISTELDIDTLCHKILVNVGHLTHADRASLFLAQGPRNSRCLVAKLFDVTVDTVLEDALTNAAEKEILLPWGVGIVGHVASTKEVINIKDAYQDPRFDASIDRRTGYRTMSVLCMPVCNYEGEVIGVAEIINKKNGTNEFTPQDVEVFRRYLTFCGIGIQNAQLFDMSVREYKRNQLLLQLARGIFEEQTSLDRLVTKIMTEARELLKCQRCSVYLLDPQMKEEKNGPALSIDTPDTPKMEHAETLVIRQSLAPPLEELMKIPPETLTVHMAFELQSQEGECRITRPSNNQTAATIHSRLANYVLATGQTVNINDVVEWLGAPLEDGGFITHNVLTIPIFNSSRQILGVAQMINKENGLQFSEHDINTFEAFAIFCGLGIQNTQVYEKACRLMARQQVALECLSYHATASQEDTERLRTAEVPTAKNFDLYNFDFCVLELSDDETLKCAIRMFMDLDLLNRYHISYEVLCRWLLSVKKNYRPVKYHNWRHAITVAQTMFAMLKTGKLEQFMSDLEMLGLLVACLCHDLDHRGTNNSFQTKTDSPLAILYSTSTMEHHHFDQCVMILSQDSNNIFQSLTGENYRKVMTLLENAILSTDMAMYFKKKNSFLELSDNGEFDWQSEEKKHLLCGMMMTACDVSAIAKPWEIQHKTAKLVADEFFEQGDLERLQLNEQPVAMMDREKKDELPKMQMGFIEAICLPLYKALSESFPWVKPLYDGCARNQEQWKRLAEQVDMGLTWIDHEYIERPVERNELEITSKITLNPKPASQGPTAPSPPKADGERGRGRLGLGSALKGARALKGGGKRRSVEKRLDRVMDSSTDQRPARMSPKQETVPSTPVSLQESQEPSSGRERQQGKSNNKLRSRLCILL